MSGKVREKRHRKKRTLRRELNKKKAAAKRKEREDDIVDKQSNSRKKSKPSEKLIIVNGNTIIHSARPPLSFPPDPPDMYPSTMRAVKNNFDVTYKPRTHTPSGIRRSIHLSEVTNLPNSHTVSPSTAKEPASSNETQVTLPTNSLHGIRFGYCPFRRLLLEDFMLLEPNEIVLVLIPRASSDYGIFHELSCHQEEEKPVILIDHVAFLQLVGTVCSNPMLGSLQTGITESVLNYHLKSNGNAGVGIRFEGTNTVVKILWKDIVKATEIQVWSDIKTIRDFYPWFRCIKSDASLRILFARLASEVKGDAVQTMGLCNTLNRRRFQMLSADNQVLTKQMQEYADVKLGGDELKQIMKHCDALFEHAIKSCYGNEFVSFSELIVSRGAMDELAAHYESISPAHFRLIEKLLGYSHHGDRNCKTSHRHLERKRRVLYNLLALSRVRNNHQYVWWAAVLAAASYGHSENSLSRTRAMFFGIQTDTKTYLRKVEQEGALIEARASQHMQEKKRCAVVADNNECHHPRKFQRGGKSSEFVLCTSRLVMEIMNFEPGLLVNKGTCNIMYIQQAIPSPLGLPPFELQDSISSSICHPVSLCAKVHNGVDYGGTRCQSYVNLLHVCEEMNAQFHYLSLPGREWAHQPALFSGSEFRSEIVARLHSCRQSSMVAARTFQNHIVPTWNLSAKTSSKFIILPVSLHNETTTKGSAMLLIEFCEMAGIVKKRFIHNPYTNVTKSRWLYYFGDCLTLDKKKAFEKHLASMEFSFSEFFEQSLVFREALKQVVSISGDLHGRFHMLWPIFDRFYYVLLHPIQVALGWKRIKTDVMQCFQLASLLTMFVLTEAEHLFYDMFLLSLENDCDSLNLDAIEPEQLSVELAGCFRTYLRSKQSSPDEGQRVLANFMDLARHFRMFGDSVRTGDSIMIEHLLVNYWTPVWFAHNKPHYQELGLSQPETHYALPYQILQEIRMNCTAQLREGTDRRGKETPRHAQDELMEAVVDWTKQLPLGSDKAHWPKHSANLTCARRCRHFVDMEYSTHFAGDEESIPFEQVNPLSTTQPGCRKEQELIYEMLVLEGLHVYDPNRKITPDFLYRVIPKLTTNLQMSTEDDENLEEKNPLEATVEQLLDRSTVRGTNNEVADVNVAEELEEEEPVSMPAMLFSRLPRMAMARKEFNPKALVNAYEEGLEIMRKKESWRFDSGKRSIRNVRNV